MTRRLVTNNFNPNRAFSLVIFQGSNYSVRGNSLIVSNGIGSDHVIGTNRVDTKWRCSPTRFGRRPGRALGSSSPVIPTSTLIFGIVANGFQLSGLGVANASYVLEASTDLAHWSPLQTRTSDAAGIYLLTDAEFGLFPARFYRVQSK